MEKVQGPRSDPLTESFDSGVKGTAVKATPQAHLATAGLEEDEPVAGREPVVETDRACVYCPAEVLQQEEGWGGGGSSGGNNLSRARGIAGEEAISAAFQGQVGCEEGMP